MAKRKQQQNLPASVTASLGEIGALISCSRKEREWSQEELAKRVGVGRMTVVRMEKGAPEVAVGCYLTAAWLLGIPLLAWQDLGEGRPDTLVSALLAKLKKKLPQRIRQNSMKIDNDF